AFAFAASVPAWAQTPAAPPAPTPAPFAPAPALGFYVGSFTNVSISGLLAVGLKESKVTNTSRPGMNTETRLDDNTSRLIVASTSKIANGWNVIFRIESRFQADVRPVDPAYNNNNLIGTATYHTGDVTGWADGDTWGGISSPYGSLVFGKSTVYYTDTINVGYLGLPAAPGESYRIWDANGLGTFNILDQVTPLTKTGVAYASTFTLGNTRSRNVIRYNSMNYSGFDFQLAWSKNFAGDELHYVAPGTAGYSRSYTNGDGFYGMVRYNKGPLSVSVSGVSQHILGGVYTPALQAGPPDLLAYRAGASYTLPIGLRLGVVYDQTSYDNSVYGSAASVVADTKAKRDTFLIPVSYGFGPHAVYATYGIAGNTSSAADTGATQLNIGYDYALTKRAFIGLYYTSIKNDKNGHYTPFLNGYSFGPSVNSTAGENWWDLGLNLNYWF
ncbi:MAG: porin, partial [Thermoanaerobaculia bacterium]